jgi:cyclopropane fatty-acyl-phospholipid synthase-like methyltransferase
MPIAQSNPYDELHYKCFPIEWTAPERLAVASLLHGGPRLSLDSYRVLELGCGDGANLLPLAYYRSNANFVGIDGACSQVDVAIARKKILGLSNLEVIHADFLHANQRLTGQFNYIIAHGVFSWVPQHVRDALFALCAQRLAPGGLLYLNYNTLPGWNVRGMVREFLIAQTASAVGLLHRAEQAQAVAAKVVASLSVGEHPYSQLLANEFQFVCDNHCSYVAHEYLAVDNYAFWRSDFLAMARSHGLEYVADADFNYSSGRLPEDLAQRLLDEQITGRTPEDTVDLLCYRQLHTPILTNDPSACCPPTADEFAHLEIASCLAPCAPCDSGNPMFQHTSGYRVEAKTEALSIVLEKLLPLWPRGALIGTTFPDVRLVMDDLMLLHRNGLVELRGVRDGDLKVDSRPLNRLEAIWGGYNTTIHHVRTHVPEEFARNTAQAGACLTGEQEVDFIGYSNESRVSDLVGLESVEKCGQ